MAYACLLAMHFILGSSVNIGASCSGECGLELGAISTLGSRQASKRDHSSRGHGETLLSHPQGLQVVWSGVVVMMGCSFMWSSLFLLIACESTAMLRSTRRKLMFLPYTCPSLLSKERRALEKHL